MIEILAMVGGTAIILFWLTSLITSNKKGKRNPDNAIKTLAELKRKAKPSGCCVGALLECPECSGCEGCCYCGMIYKKAKIHE